MKKFRFRLQKVLDTRESAEREAQRLMADALRILNELEIRKKEIEDELNTVLKEQKSLFNGGTSAGKAMQHHRWQRELQKQLRVQEEKCLEAEQVVAKRRAELLEASRERKVLEKLKEKKRTEHKAQDHKEQQATLDDIGGRHTLSGRRTEHA